MAEPTKRTKNIYEKIFAVQQQVATVLKLGHNDFHKYNYAYERDIIAEIKPLLGEQKLLILNTGEERVIEETQVIEGKIVGGDKVFVSVRYKIVNIENPTEVVEGIGYGEGKDSGDKATPKALTMALKYYLSKTFLIETGDDAENERKGQGGASQPSTEQMYETASLMIKSSRNIDGLMETAGNINKSKKYTKKQKDDLSKLIKERVDELQK
ncbi:MAG: ERF family protein [Candidatus Pacearchaeota archaeon]|nr:ERF family protein [Candidatus Pacearchaeota archaeon]